MIEILGCFFVSKNHKLSINLIVSVTIVNIGLIWR